MPVGRAREIVGDEVQVQVVAYRDAPARAEKLRVAVDKAGGQQPFFQHALRAVEVAEQPIQQSGALDDAALDRAPLVRVEQQREQIEAPLAARLAIAGERHVVLDHEPLRFLCAACSRRCPSSRTTRAPAANAAALDQRRR
jgi:hypothetical protein